jgi:hypothetical protein
MSESVHSAAKRVATVTENFSPKKLSVSELQRCNWRQCGSGIPLAHAYRAGAPNLRNLRDLGVSAPRAKTHGRGADRVTSRSTQAFRSEEAPMPDERFYAKLAAGENSFGGASPGL